MTAFWAIVAFDAIAFVWWLREHRLCRASERRVKASERRAGQHEPAHIESRRSRA